MGNSRNYPQLDLMEECVRRCLHQHVRHDQHVVVGLSGGRDSVALLHSVLQHQSALGFHLSACHVNHHLSTQAGNWQLFCQELCTRLKIPLTTIAVDVPTDSGKGLEAAARRERYSALVALPANWILLGHHRDDQAETLMFNMLRGTGLLGAAGMPELRALRPGLGLLRPLLGVDRTEIDLYLSINRLSWVEDESNDSAKFSRNFIRNEVMPLLKSRFPAAAASLANATGRFAEAQRLLDELAMLDLGLVLPSFPFPIIVFFDLSESRGRNLLRFLLTKNGVQIPSEQRLVEAMRQFRTAAPDRHPVVAFGDVQLRRQRGELHLEVNNS